MNIEALSHCWQQALSEEVAADYFLDLANFVSEERAALDVFPPAENVFEALRATPLSDVRVLILGQDPYHGEGQAHGLSFSVLPGVKIPPSLRNIFKELHDDLGIEPATHGCLSSWAQQGVLLLNTVLTVRSGEANSHRKRGWERFTDRVIDCVNGLPHVAFVLWGKPSQKKAERISDRHLVVQSPHPSPLSARTGFFGSKPFSQIDEYLRSNGTEPINWRLPEVMA